ncbi:lysosomal alpha-mannosidase-like [Euwallacea fornicatus]|uniref:lysosomal alpha-mannosidase-like n=1 Tax=Euwallacea fornicatus TaxID=995702 RepID=UPI00338EA431
MNVLWGFMFTLSLVELASSIDPPFSPHSTETPPSNTTCGYESCHPLKEGFINIHIVPHTHDDVGWLKTVDQYYYGSNTSIQNAGVQYILDTVVDSLLKDSDRRFIYVETAFFWKWWMQQHDIVKARVRRFVRSGQLEFISGGWCMNDEAATHYQSIIDQMTWGLRKLNDTFGECGRPKIGWQIDPFGHSKEMANIFAQLGFDALLLGRVDYQEKQIRWQTRTPEMVWRASSSLGESSDIFTGILYNTYGPPPGFCFDLLCTDEPFIDDKKSFEYNVDRKVDEFIEYLDNATQVYVTDNILITMGEDFHYQDAEVWFKNLDKLIYYVNQRQENGSKYNLVYSTPSCYVKAVHDEAEAKNKNKWPLKQDDFFPYASDPHAFWTGYFTSRPTVKRYERVGNNFLQVCKQLYALADLGPEDRADLNILREAMGVMQHHDAITGTEKQHVADDYERHLELGFEECELVTTAAINKLLNQTLITLNTCHLLNISECSETETKDKEFIVTIYNPLSRNVDKVVRLPVLGSTYSVSDSQGNNLTTQILPIPEFVRNIPGRIGKAQNELLFIATDLPPLGWKSYIVSEISDEQLDHIPVSEDIHTNRVKDTAFLIDPNTGLLTKIVINNLEVPVSQNFYYYKGFVGDNRQFENRSSGAYIFRPDGALVKVAEKINYTIYRGDIVAEVHQVFNEYISQIIRVNAIDNYVEFDWVVGPIPHDGTSGIEVVTKYTSDLKSDSTFYTDSNGKELLKRVRNFRPTWKLNLSEPVTGNYYPVTSQISIRDETADMDLAVLVDRAQGGSSLNDGEIELMVHRLCLHDDAFGVGEALNETAFGKGLVARGSHYITIGTKNSENDKSIAAITKDVAQRRLLDTWTFVTPKPNKDDVISYDLEFSGLRQSLPENVQILTLEPWIGFSFLLRVEHVFEKGEDSVLSQPTQVNLATIFNSFEIVSARETTLGGNQWLADNVRLHFGINGSLEDSFYHGFEVDAIKDTTVSKMWMEQNLYQNRVERYTVISAEDNGLEITLNPGQIRTFIVEIKK